MLRTAKEVDRLFEDSGEENDDDVEIETPVQTYKKVDDLIKYIPEDESNEEVDQYINRPNTYVVKTILNIYHRVNKAKPVLEKKYMWTRLLDIIDESWPVEKKIGFYSFELQIESAWQLELLFPKNKNLLASYRRALIKLVRDGYLTSEKRQCDLPKSKPKIKERQSKRQMKDEAIMLQRTEKRRKTTLKKEGRMMIQKDVKETPSATVLFQQMQDEYKAALAKPVDVKRFKIDPNIKKPEFKTNKRK